MKRTITENGSQAPPDALSFDALCDRLKNPAAAERRFSALQLARFPQAAPELCACLPAECEAAVREAMLTALMQINSEEAVCGLLPLLRSEDAALRNGVVEALQQMPTVVAPHMQALLTDADSDVRLFALDILQALCHPDAPNWLAALIATEQHVNVCATAVDRLAELGTPEMIPRLRELTTRFSQEPFMQFAVQAAITRITGNR